MVFSKHRRGHKLADRERCSRSTKVPSHRLSVQLSRICSWVWLSSWLKNESSEEMWGVVNSFSLIFLKNHIWILPSCIMLETRFVLMVGAVNEAAGSGTRTRFNLLEQVWSLPICIVPLLFLNIENKPKVWFQFYKGFKKYLYLIFFFFENSFGATHLHSNLSDKWAWAKSIEIVLFAR